MNEMLDFGQALALMFDGAKMCTARDKTHYYCVKDNRIWYGNSKEEDSLSGFSCKDILASDWQHYKEPKKWTKEDIRKAKAGLELGLEWVTRDYDVDGYLKMHTNEPYKSNQDKMWFSGGAYLTIPRNSFNSVKWEDVEPTRLQDIADSEAGDE